MMSRIDRIARSAFVRRPLALEAPRPHAPPPPAPPSQPAGVSGRAYSDSPARGESELAAQLMGQDGTTRGLRGGPTVIEAAQSAYNRVEWSGRYDRRAAKGSTTRAQV
ncbi:hypothetical protein [Phenylobacterium sp.]|jgi:hypothetical protein|uniref:hypothetical protein n=1 Tax=Phenylobacterium sp. TaxID=1871053 RepID=UPI0037CC9045